MKKKRQGWGPAEFPQQHYLVHPRALAGGGDIRHVSEYLRATGWKDNSKRGGPLAMESPDRMVRIAYDPYTQPGGWTIHGKASGHQDEWWAVLGQQTPVEVVMRPHRRPQPAPLRARSQRVGATSRAALARQAECQTSHRDQSRRQRMAAVPPDPGRNSDVVVRCQGRARQRLGRPVHPHHPDAPRASLLDRSRQPRARDASTGMRPAERTNPHHVRLRAALRSQRLAAGPDHRRPRHDLGTQQRPKQPATHHGPPTFPRQHPRARR